MAQKSFPTRIDLEHGVDAALEKWAENEGKSKRRHAAILIRKLVSLKDTHPEELKQLGIIDRILTPSN